MSNDGSFEPQVNESIIIFKYFMSEFVKIPHLEFVAPVRNALSKEGFKKNKKLFSVRQKDTQRT